MRSKFISSLLIIICMASCRSPDPSQDLEGIKKEKIADAILRKVATELKHETELRPVGNMGQMLGDVERLGLSFFYYKNIDIVEGRKLLVQAVNAMLTEVNQEKRIHPYLCRYPFLPRNIEIEIFLRNPDGRDVPQGNLWIVRADRGYLEYRIDHPTTKRLVTIYKETYEEAVQRLADPSLPLVPFQPDPVQSQEELNRLRKGISFVSDDGAIWHLGENGSWVRDR